MTIPGTKQKKATRYYAWCRGCRWTSADSFARSFADLEADLHYDPATDLHRWVEVKVRNA